MSGRELYDLVKKYLESKGYYLFDYGLFALEQSDDIDYTMMIGTAWEDSSCNLWLTDSEAANTGPSIKVSSLEEAQTVIDNFRLANEVLVRNVEDMYERVVAVRAAMTEIAKTR